MLLSSAGLLRTAVGLTGLVRASLGCCDPAGGTHARRRSCMRAIVGLGHHLDRPINNTLPVEIEVTGAAKGAPLQQLQQRELNVLNVLVVAGREGLTVLGRSLSAGRHRAHVVHDRKHAQVTEGHRVIVELLGGEEEAAEE
eukprot:scaffold122754_cov68-Phaeocystis_antarctica.AAC.2